MADRDNLQVSGFRFGSMQDVEAAREEEQKIRYFKGRMKNKSSRLLLPLYDKLLDEKVFKTPVGFEYLRELQEQMKEAGVSDEQIRPIPLYTNFSYMTGEELNKSRVRQRIRPSRKKPENSGLFFSVCVNILLVILTIAMFVITLESDNPNVLNYKHALINEYAAWEQELTDRESKVREKEKELHIEPALSDERGE